jgi:hypothetical protein
MHSFRTRLTNVSSSWMIIQVLLKQSFLLAFFRCVSINFLYAIQLCQLITNMFKFYLISFLTLSKLIQPWTFLKTSIQNFRTRFRLPLTTSKFQYNTIIWALLRLHDVC